MSPRLCITMHMKLNKISWLWKDPCIALVRTMRKSSLWASNCSNNEAVKVVTNPNCCQQPHRISVRSVTVTRRTSRDAACTMVIGRDTANMGPTCVRASGVTCSQAVISWLPANSNHQHVVCVNNVEVSHTINKLSFDSIHTYIIIVFCFRKARIKNLDLDALEKAINTIIPSSHLQKLALEQNHLNHLQLNELFC